MNDTDTAAMIRKACRKWGLRSHFSLVEDMEQEAALAVFLGRDPIDAIRKHWKKWRMGKVPRKRWPNFEPPKMVEWAEGDSIDETGMESVIAVRRAIEKLNGKIDSRGKGWNVIRRTLEAELK